jgi:two-component system phosphate regulon sensor histidine kinase PhoR
MSTSNDKTNQETEVLGDVEAEVRQWISEQKREIILLKNLEQYRKEFLGNISHELKTPLFSVQGYVHTLLDGGLHDESINLRYLERTAKNIDRLQTIVEDLDIIAKLEDSTMILDMQPFDIRELVQNVILELEVQAKEKNIDIQLKSGADKTLKVLADREYIRTVLINLIANSIKYGKENGLTKVGFYNMHSYALIEIADNGIGMEEKHLRHLFDRFYRVDKSRSREMGGSGLGLSIVKHIIEAHEQSINVRSTPDIGSTFGFTLKLA